MAYQKIWILSLAYQNFWIWACVPLIWAKIGKVQRFAREDAKTPCDVSRVEDNDFGLQCSSDYFGRRYVCDPDQVLSATEVDRIDGDILKKADFYYFCARCQFRTADVCIDNLNIIGNMKDHFLYKHRRQIRRAFSWRNASVALTQGGGWSSPSYQEYYERYIKKRKHLPPLLIAINIYSQMLYPHTPAMVKKYLPCAVGRINSSNEGQRPKLEEDQILDAYGVLSNEKWRLDHHCYPNVTILFFAGHLIEYAENGQRKETYRRPKIHVLHTFSSHQSQAWSWLGGQIKELVRKLNNDNATSVGSTKLEKFLQGLTQLYEEANQKRRHSIPFWALITFAVCAVISLIAVLIGNFVTSADHRSSRRVKQSSKGQSSRKWRAGFSGGMWASV